MQTFVALLRGINVGGNNILPMTELKALCEEAGFKNVRTYIQSGNVIFESKLSEDKVLKKLEKALKTKLEKVITVIIRTIAELDKILEKNPFPEANPAQVGILFFTEKVPANILQEFKNAGPEEIVLSGREIYIHFPNGMGQSKLKFPKIAENGTVRNVNTIRKLAELGNK
ncbi:MAG: DUF1697 domain-containing protein [Bacteroidota bacterium]|nr:DUF1697 domain-containing protein [Bacteroidota bacterium]